jgi:hypothetical protein
MRATSSAGRELSAAAACARSSRVASETAFTDSSR